MRYIVLSVYDRAAGAYGRPVFALSLGSAIRSFEDEIKRDSPENEMFRHPKDFDLYELGSFDDGPGSFELLPDPRCVAIGGQMGFAFDSKLQVPVRGNGGAGDSFPAKPV